MWQIFPNQIPCWGKQENFYHSILKDSIRWEEKFAARGDGGWNSTVDITLKRSKVITLSRRRQLNVYKTNKNSKDSHKAAFAFKGNNLNIKCFTEIYCFCVDVWLVWFCTPKEIFIMDKNCWLDQQGQKSESFRQAIPGLGKKFVEHYFSHN